MIKLNDSAKKVLSQLIIPANSLGVRIKVQSAGCSGYAYVMEWAYGEENDLIISEPINIYIDSKSLIFLFGSELEYKVNQFQEGFEFVNPNEASKCGCGESFYIA